MEWPPEGHLAYFVLELVRELDVSGIEDTIQTDRREDEPYAREGRTDELPEEFQRRDARLRRIREAKAALEKEAAEARAAQLRELAANQQRLSTFRRASAPRNTG